MKGRSKGEGGHVRHYLTELQSPAYRSLCVGARALLIELKSLFHGNNNGELFLSVREAARRLHAGKSSVMDWFWELEDRGFVKPKVEAGFTWKTAARERMATCWTLTEFPTPGAAPTRDYMHWQGPPKLRPKNIRRSGIGYSLYPTPDSLYPTRDSTPKSVPETGQIRPKSPQKRAPLYLKRDTDSYQGVRDGAADEQVKAHGPVVPIKERAAAHSPRSGRNVDVEPQPSSPSHGDGEPRGAEPPHQRSVARRQRHAPAAKKIRNHAHKKFADRVRKKKPDALAKKKLACRRHRDRPDLGEPAAVDHFVKGQEVTMLDVDKQRLEHLAAWLSKLTGQRGRDLSVSYIGPWLSKLEAVEPTEAVAVDTLVGLAELAWDQDGGTPLSNIEAWVSDYAAHVHDPDVQQQLAELAEDAERATAHAGPH